VVDVCVAAVLLWWVAAPVAAAWPWLVASVVLHGAYNAGLLIAYRVGDFNLTYPLARGVGPLVVAVVAAAFIGEPLAPLPAIGVVLIAGAIGVLGLTPWRRIRANRSALVAAVLTGLAIAGYTLLDGIGVRRSGSAAGYALWLMALQGGSTLVVILLLRRRRPAEERSAIRWRIAALAGVMSMLAYGLVLWAQTRGALAAVAALRESSVVVAAVLGVLLFGEPMGRVRVAAAVAVAAGVVLLAVPVTI
jgi:drug/metabolite transporter (DMT)-like permease